MKTKLFLLAVVAAIIASYFIFDLGNYLNLEYLKHQKESLNALYDERPILVASVFFLAYFLVAGLALPAAALLTVAAGAILGFWVGLLVVSFASTLGATMAFLLTRYLLHETVERKFGERLGKVNQGIEREGALYVFSLRLVPAFPFVVVNSVLALTKLKTWTFYWASQIGMLAGTAVYVNAGTQLAELDSLGDILSWQFALSFALLGIFPFIAKYALKFFSKRSDVESDSADIQ